MASVVMLAGGVDVSEVNGKVTDIIGYPFGAHAGPHYLTIRKPVHMFTKQESYGDRSYYMARLSWQEIYQRSQAVGRSFDAGNLNELQTQELRGLVYSTRMGDVDYIGNGYLVYTHYQSIGD